MTFSTSAPLRVGIIGCGALGLVHAQRLSAMPGVTVCAVSDPDAAAMGRVIAALPPCPEGKAEAFADYRDLLTRGGLDAVSINSPNRWHVEQLLAALEHGLHILCEKPLSMVPDEVSQVVQATQSAGKVVAIAYQSRYRRDSRVLRRLLQSGQWGRVTSVSVFACEDWVRPNVGTWRHDPTRCPGGYFADANGHQLDLLFWLTGLEAAWVRATTETRGTPVPIVTWGEARLHPQEEAALTPVKTPPQPSPSQGEGVTPPQPSPSQGEGVTSSPTPLIAKERGALDSPPPYEGGGRGEVPVSAEAVPFTFTFVGDAHLWRDEISITTEGADFLLRDTRLYWTDGKGPVAPFPESEMHPDDLACADTPDGAFIATLRGEPQVVSAPETVWPVLRFTLSALASAANGSAPQPTAETR